MPVVTHIPSLPRTASVSALAARDEGLTKVFGWGDTRVVALDHVDVAFPRESFTAIMGPSGSGKSTLMHSPRWTSSPQAGPGSATPSSPGSTTST